MYNWITITNFVKILQDPYFLNEIESIAFAPIGSIHSGTATFITELLFIRHYFSIQHFLLKDLFTGTG